MRWLNFCSWLLHSLLVLSKYCCHNFSTISWPLFLFFKEIAHQDINALPRDSSIVRIRSRCAVTSRPRGVVYRWRLSRIVWRQLADYNKLSGVQRAMWWSCNYKNEINKCLVNFIWRFRLMFVANERYLKTETHSSCLNWSSNGHHLQRII